MYGKGDAKRSGAPQTYLVDTDLFFFYLRGVELGQHAERLIERASAGDVVLRTSSELYDDTISSIRGRGNPLEIALQFVADMKTIPHEAVAVSAEIAEEALRLYGAFGSSRRLHYFDAFHVATGKRYDLSLVTSDGCILEHQADLKIVAKNLADL